MLAAWRRARYGYLLAFQRWWWCAAGSSPTEIAMVLFGARSRVCRTVRAEQAGTLGLKPDAQGRLVSLIRTTVRLPTLRRSLLALLQAPARALGVLYALELCHAGADAADHTGTHGRGRDAAALAARTRLGGEASHMGRQRR
jgi:hypothetical protein